MALPLRFWRTGALLSCLVLTACQTKAPQQRYPLMGKVVAVHKDQRLVTIEHEAIPGYMAAMTMPFVVKDDWALGVLALSTFGWFAVRRGRRFWSGAAQSRFGANP